MSASMESEMASSVISNRTSTRFSTYSTAPSMATSSTPLTSNQQSCSHSAADHRPEHEITHIQTTLSKLSDKKLASQRFVPSQEKTENLSKLALGAKLDRALARRMGGQDAVMKAKGSKMTEKMNEKLAVN